ncbi:unannotated protein [freshwater metagenome]|uniref:Unannotated protein n=1 Tax=freshwater metagenome TaxID=449393 RepID=A0A6J7KVL0_9ZZZZ
MRLSLGRSAAPLAFGLVLAGGLAGCGGATTSITGSTLAPSPTVTVDRKADWTGTDTCAGGGVCAVGDTGPGGGTVFYVANPDESWGNYLEAAPGGWNGTDEDPNAKWCSKGLDSFYLSSGIGSGYANTVEMGIWCDNANVARSYKGGGKSDWFLPSIDELNEFYEQRETVGGFGDGSYWSSSMNLLGDAWCQRFSDGDQSFYGTQRVGRGIRPVRMF